MKDLLSTLSPGQRIECKVHEVVNQGGLIVSFSGQLLRVQNHSKKHFNKNDTIELRVLTVKPPQFQLVDKSRLDINA